MMALHNAVQSAIKNGKKLDDLVKTEGDKQVANVQLPDIVKTWVGPSLAAQVKDAYNEIVNKKPAGDQPH
jgi:hypothetical protein